MDNYEINSLNNYLKKQITEMPLILRDELIYEHQKFNTRNDLDHITPIIDDFLNGDNINRYFVIPGIIPNPHFLKNNNIFNNFSEKFRNCLIFFQFQYFDNFQNINNNINNNHKM